MDRALRGIPASAGIAEGTVHILLWEVPEVPHRVIPDEDVPALRECGVADVVPQDTPPDEVVSRVRAAVEARRAR